MAIGSKDPFFPSIGEHALATDSVDDQFLHTEVDGEYHPVEEIESLCMECHENVRSTSLRVRSPADL